jgi:hypothetical protein
MVEVVVCEGGLEGVGQGIGGCSYRHFGSVGVILSVRDRKATIFEDGKFLGRRRLVSRAVSCSGVRWGVKRSNLGFARMFGMWRVRFPERVSPWPRCLRFN